MTDRLPSPLREAFRVLALAFIPEMEALDAGGWQRAEAAASGALGRRPAAVRRQLGLFVRFLDMWSLARHGRRLAHLDPVALRGWLEHIQFGSCTLFRKGLWGLRTVVFIGYYGLAETRERVGYGAHPGGWRSRAGGERR